MVKKSKLNRSHFYIVKYGDYCSFTIKSEQLYYLQHLIEEERSRLFIKLEHTYSLPECSLIRELKSRLECLNTLSDVLFTDNLDLKL